MVDWVLMVLTLGLIALIAWAAYKLGIEEGWRSAGRYADTYLIDAFEDGYVTARFESRPALPDDDEVAGPPYAAL